MGEALAASGSRFPRTRFEGLAGTGLEELDLKQRVDQVATALVAELPGRFEDAAAMLDRALESPEFRGWMLYPVNEYVARAGIEEPELALPLLSRLTGRWSAEFAIRPFIERHLELTYRHLHGWTGSTDEHLRRLVSEGTRPRLPWGRRLRQLVADPSPSLPLLDALVADPSEYVRRSVANHLNDIAKDHPELAVAVAAGWLESAGPAQAPAAARSAGQPGSGRSARVAWVVRHGLRTRIKSGDPAALALLGFDPEVPIAVKGFELSPTTIRIGETVSMTLTLAVDPEARVSDAAMGGGPPAGGDSAPLLPIMVDYRLHFQGANGVRRPKVFKWSAVELDPRRSAGPLILTRRHRFQHASVRRLHPGPHLIEAQVNGRVLAAATLELELPPTPA